MAKLVYLKTTEGCNLNCSHCFTNGTSGARDLWNVEKVTSWINRFIAATGDERVHFEFHGGEPMLAPVEQLALVRDVIRSHSTATVGITTNLVYKLTEERKEFLLSLDSVATSWDSGIRFANDKQEQLWRDNLKVLTDAGKALTINISVSKAVVNMDQKKLLLFLRDTHCTNVQFERITHNGNAVGNIDLFPTNQEINKWYMDIHEATEQLGARDWFNNTALESVYAKFENGANRAGTFCRNCEESLFTINPDGSIAGCPNGAANDRFGNIDHSIEDLLSSRCRVDLIVKEKIRNHNCFGCPVYQYCGGDCHRLAWDGDVCASPKQLMIKLAGLESEYSPAPINKKVFIPVVRI